METIIIEINKHAIKNDISFVDSLSQLIEDFSKYNSIDNYLKLLKKDYLVYSTEIIKRLERVNYSSIELINHLDVTLRNRFIVEDSIVINKRVLNGYHILKSYVEINSLRYIQDNQPLLILLFNEIDYYACIVYLYYYLLDVEKMKKEDIYSYIFKLCRLRTSKKRRHILAKKKDQNESVEEKQKSITILRNDLDQVIEIDMKPTTTATRTISTDTTYDISNTENQFFYDNTIYITNDIIHSYIIEYTDTENLYTFLEVDKIIDKDCKDYKKYILSRYTPIDIYKDNHNLDNDNNRCERYVFSKLNIKPCNVFSINDICYGCLSNWLANDQEKIEIVNLDLVRDLKLFDLEEEYYKKKNEIFNNYRNKDYGLKIRFKNLDIRNSTLLNPKYRSVILDDILIHISTSPSSIKKLESGFYPIVTSIATNNGISKYVNKYDTKASETDKIISIGLRKTGTGVSFVHSYYFAHSVEVSLFKLKEDIDLNEYNVAFSINTYTNERKFKRDICMKEILKWNVLVIEK